MCRLLLALIASLAITVASPARGQPGSGPYQDAPRPEEAHGRRSAPEAKAGWRWVPRAVLFVPRLAIKAIAWAPRQTLRAYDRYRLKARFLEVFFNDDRRIGVFPSFFAETGFGLNAGVRYLHRDIAGTGAKARLRVGYGGTSRFLVSGGFTTSRMWRDRVRFEIDGVYRQGPRERFFGYGDADLEPTAPPAADVDPIAATAAYDTRFQQSGASIDLGGSLALTDALSLRLVETYDQRSFSRFGEGDNSVETVFDVARLPGYAGVSNLYSELQLILDTREVSHPYLWAPAHSTGWRLAGKLGYQAGFADDPSRHLRWDVDVQRLIDLYGGDRVLVIRILSESLVGDIDRIPFVSLPMLGGPELLRGYSRGRFRDKHAVIGTLEYRYPLLRMASGFLFVDAGQVFRSWDQFDPLSSRVAYGGGIQLHSQSSMLARLFVGSSIDGGLFLRASFSPALEDGSAGAQDL